jgi:PAS domain S-box-containing protein
MSETEFEILQSFCDSVPLGICLVDLQGKIRYWNAATESITGYFGHEVLGRAYRGDLLIHNSTTTPAAVEMKCPIMEVLREGRSVEADLFLRHKEGHRIPVHVYAFPMRNSMGEVVGVGEVLDPAEVAQESPAWLGHSDREFECHLVHVMIATETREQYKSRLAGYVEGKSCRTSGRSTSHYRGTDRRVPEEVLRQRPAKDKWSVTEILAHLAEDELVSSWRYRQMLEHDTPSLLDFDQDVWASLGHYVAWSTERRLRDVSLFARGEFANV